MTTPSDPLKQEPLSFRQKCSVLFVSVKTKISDNVKQFLRETVRAEVKKRMKILVERCVKDKQLEFYIITEHEEITEYLTQIVMGEYIPPKQRNKAQAAIQVLITSVFIH